MNTKHAETEGAMERLRADMAQMVAVSAKRDASRDAAAAQRDVDAAKRDKDNLRFQIGLAVAIIVVLGVLIRWPG